MFIVDPSDVKLLLRSTTFEDGVTFTNQPKEKIIEFMKKVHTC